MTTQHIGDEDELVTAEPADNPGQPEPVDNSGQPNSVTDQPEPAENPHEMERSLPAPKTFNIDAADLYSEWKHWLSAFDIYAIASDLKKKDDAVQRATMLHCLGPAVQRIFNTLPGDHKTFEEVKTALSGHFAPKRNVVAERYKFRSRAQKTDESIDTYLTSLRELVKSCDFGTLEEEMIRDQIVEKCSSRTLKQKLLQQDDLDLAKTIKIARSAETAVQETLLLSQGTKENPIQIDHVHASRRFPAKQFSCYRCGGTDGHSPDECGAIKATCNSCKKVGHLQKVCRSKPKATHPTNRHKQRSAKKEKKAPAMKVRSLRSKSTNWLEDSSSDESEPVLSMNNVDSSITVQINGQRTKMIVDTGCKYNIISSKLYKSQFKNYELSRTQKRFTAYGQKEPLKCNGYFNATIRAGDKTISTKVYVIEGNAEVLLGRDSSFKLEILTQVNSIDQASAQGELDALLKEYDDIFQGLGKVTDFEHKITIDPEVKPVSQHLRRIPVSQIEPVNNELVRMLEQDIIEEVTEASPWVSNLVIVPKKSGDLRVCCDLREVNKAVIRERYVLPKVEDTLHAMHGSKYFAKIDAKSGFFQLTLAEESRHVTTFITPRGCYRFKRTPFGLSDASEAFQKMMEKILFGIEGVRISVDDVIIYAETMAELVKRVRNVFNRCREYNLKLNRSKCEFGVKQISILGHVVSEKGIEPDPAKTEAIRATPPPDNVSDLRSFLGTSGYVAKFIPNYANIAEPLRKLTRKEQKWSWGPERAKAFKALKEALSGAPVLARFRVEAPTYVVTDASPVGLGAILLQDQGTGERKPIAYISRSLTSTERRYSQIDREALGCVWAVERLHNYLFGIKFTLLTDNKPLSSMFEPHSSKVLPPRIQRLAWRLHQYNFCIQHIAGNANTADSLSRLPSMQDDLSDTGFVCENYVRFVYASNMLDLQAVTFSDIRSETSKDVTLSKLLIQIQSGKWSHDLKPYDRVKEELSVFEGVILRGNRIVVPQSLQKQILKLAHETHQGIVKTKQFLRTRYGGLQFFCGSDVSMYM